MNVNDPAKCEIGKRGSDGLVWSATRQVIRIALLAATTLSISGCDRPSSERHSVLSKERHSNESFRSHNLTIYGYNYSDSGLSSFEVNGQGGGNLEVSTPSAGGAKHICCTSIYAPLSAPKSVTIKWSRDTEVWCEQTVMLNPPLPANPKYFEVHFYPDGHIEVAVTEEASEPRLRLERDSPGSRNANEAMNVNNDDKRGVCKRGYQ